MKTDVNLLHRILVVEDDEDMRKNLRRILGAAGYEVSMAEDGAEAMTLLRTRPCHLVLTDLVMPGMGGLELLKEIRQQDQNLPVVFLSAFGDRATFARATELGAVDFVTKPFRADFLLRLIQRTLGGQPSK
jgi:DNA-binding NtrC family response regulator